MIIYKSKNKTMDGIMPDKAHKVLVQVSSLLMVIVALLTIYNFYLSRKMEKQEKTQAVIA